MTNIDVNATIINEDVLVNIDIDDIEFNDLIESLLYRPSRDKLKLSNYNKELLNLTIHSFYDLASKQKFEFLITKIDDYTLEQLKEKLS